MKKVYLIAAMLIAGSIANAVEIDLDTAVNMAYKNNFEVKKAEKDVDTAKIQRGEAMKSLLPTVSYGFTYAKMENETDLSKGSKGGKVIGMTTGTGIEVLSLPSETIKIPGSDNLYSHGIKVKQPIYVGGMEWAGLEMANSGERKANLQIEQQKANTRQTIISDYLQVVKAEKNKAILENAIKELSENYKKMEEMANLKMVPKTSVLEMKSRTIDMESNLIGVNTGVELAKLTLKNDIGIDAKEELKLKEFKTDFTKGTTFNLEEDIKYALKNKRAVKMLEIYKRVVKENINLARGGVLPTIYAFFNYDWKAFKLEDSFKSENGSWTAGLTINMSIWDWGITFDKMGEKTNDLIKAELDEKNTLNMMEMGIRAGYLEMDRLKKLIDAKKAALDNAKENYNIEKDKLDMKMSTATDFLSAENLLRKAETDVATTEIDYYIAIEKYKNLIEREEK